MSFNRRTRVVLVQQGIWNMPLESMPLAAAYLKSMALADDRVRATHDIKIQNFKGEVTLSAMANELFAGEVPDVICFSVLGWNYRTFGSLAETFKILNPSGWVVFGGTHVADQGERVFRMFPDVDVVVNGEGELTLRDLLLARLDGVPVDGLDEVEGVSFRDGGAVRTTAARVRIEDLDIIPSPFLTGAVELTTESGDFRYDVALMETNRGCPYKCSFCYWGGAVGQRVRSFSRERLRQELELFAKLKVHTIVLCDANFGMLQADLEFVTDLIEIRDRYGFPQALESSWAKNKSKVFFEIVRTMKQAGMYSSFTLALQTLNDEALGHMKRRNMKLNAWEELTEWLDGEGLDCYAELIWGAPGETVETFMDGYDRLARRVSRIAVYPLLLLPNTDYSANKEKYGIVSVRGDADDFEYVLSHDMMTFDENQRMHRFIFWSRVLAENAVFRHIWVALRELAGLTQSSLLTSVDRWVAETDDPVATVLRDMLRAAVGGFDTYGKAVRYCFADPEASGLFRRWFDECVIPQVPVEVVDVLREVFEYDLVTQPACIEEGEDLTATGLVEEVVGHESYYVRSGVVFQYDVPVVIEALRSGRTPYLSPLRTEITLFYRPGAAAVVESTNHEVVMHFMGVQLAELLAGGAVRPPGGQRGPSREPVVELDIVPLDA